MAISFLVAVEARATATSVTTGAVDTTGATLFVLFFATERVLSSSSASDSKGNTWTDVGTEYANSGKKIRCYYSIPTTVGTGHTFTGTPDVSGKNTVGLLAFSGTAAASVLDANGPIGKASTFVDTITPTAAFTPSVDNGVVCSANYFDKNAATETITDGTFTLASNPTANGNLDVATAYCIQTTATSVQPTWNCSLSGNVYFGTMDVAFKPAAGGGGGAGPSLVENYTQFPKWLLRR